MNRIPCDMIEDLLPLYCDGVCSEESRKMIDGHLAACESCREALRAMAEPMELPRIQADAAAASRGWKKMKRRVLWMGLLLAALAAAVGLALFCGSHYLHSADRNDPAALEEMLEGEAEAKIAEIGRIVQKADYLAVSACAEDGKWCVGIFTRDHIFRDRWRVCGSMSKVRAGKLASWNYKTPEGDTVLVCFGAELSGRITGYTFTNSGVTYICPVEESGVLDFFFIPDAYDGRTHLEAIYEPE